jgi:surface carbohydrate biosynthesis protein
MNRSNRNKYVYIFIEVARREMDSRLALAVHLSKKGYSVVVGEKNQLLWNIMFNKYPPGVIFDKCAQIANTRNFEKLIKKGFVYTVLDEEGLITNSEYFTNSRFCKNAEKYVSANFVVGKHLNDLILNVYRDAKNIISGNPRYSMLLPDWKHWFSHEYDLIKKNYNDFVLLVSSFNPYPQTYKDTFSGMKEIDDFYKLKLKNYLKSQKQSNLNFVLRPHPSDQPYGFTELKIDDRFNIIPWISASDYILNAKCTTSIEAFIAGKRAYTWKLVTKEVAYKLANIFADDINEFDKPVLDSVQDRRKRILNNLLSFNNSPFDSLQIIANKIEELSFFSKKKIGKISIHRCLHFKNKIRFIIKGDNYTRITQKFTKKDIKYAEQKLSRYINNCVVKDKVLEINC